MEDANAWVKEQTRGLIPEILKDIDESCRVILANAVYFKAAWSGKFDKYLTKDQYFRLLDGTSRKVPFMSASTSYPQRVSVFDTFKVASLPYKVGGGKSYKPRQFSMLIFLPNDRDGLPSLIERACSESGFIDRHVPPKAVMVHEFKIPKFKFGLDFKLEDTLRELGMGSVFSGESSGFTGMVEDPAGRELYVSKMFHKAVISVDEEGTEAAAVTMGLMLGCCLRREEAKLKFVADHPFLFVIREEGSGAVLFLGQVLDPSLH